MIILDRTCQVISDPDPDKEKVADPSGSGPATLLEIVDFCITDIFLSLMNYIVTVLFVSHLMGQSHEMDQALVGMITTDFVQKC